MGKRYDIFVSYRRSGGFESANLMAEKLRGMGYSVFFDVESLRSGKFNEQLYNVIDRCRDVIVVLPEKSLDRCSNEDGSPNMEDWVRKEVTFAMEKKKNIIPVMLAGFEWPKVMPVGMEALKDYQAITATSHEYFDMAMQRMAGYLQSKPHKFASLKRLLTGIALVMLVAVIAYFCFLQIAKPVCTSVANEMTFGMGIVHELRMDEENVSKAWMAFVNDYNKAATSERKQNLKDDFLQLMDSYSASTEQIRKQIRPAMEFSDWQSFLLGLYGSQTEDIEAIPLMVDSYCDDLDTLVSNVRRTIDINKSYETENMKFHFDFFEHSVNMMYYSYLQEICLFPASCRKGHDQVSRSWNLFPNVSLALPVEEYETLAAKEVSIMDELLNNFNRELSVKSNDLYDLEERIDALDEKADQIR